MMEEQPDILQQEDFLTRQLGLTVQGPTFGVGLRPCLANTRQAQHILRRLRAFERRVVRQRSHSLKRSFLEVDANYKQYQTAQRLRVAAAQRLDAQCSYYEEGRITIDRFLDAISQYATAVATEHQHLATYNIALAALGEAKGTLLADRNIVVVEPVDRHPTTQVAGERRDDQAKTASFEPAENGPAKSSTADAKLKTWTFSISIGWDKPLQIKGTISADHPVVPK
jgi:hypothetical protein